METATLPISAFQEAAANWHANQAEKVAASSLQQTGSVVGEFEPSKNLLDSLTALSTLPVILPVQWNDQVPINHPVRQLPVYVKLWDAASWQNFWNVRRNDADCEKAASTDNSIYEPRLQWYVFLVSICDDKGVSPYFSGLFTDPDLSEACDKLRTIFSGPKDRAWVDCVIDQALKYNGLVSTNEGLIGKNSETTDSSTSSGG